MRDSEGISGLLPSIIVLEVFPVSPTSCSTKSESSNRSNRGDEWRVASFKLAAWTFSRVEDDLKPLSYPVTITSSRSAADDIGSWF